MEWHKDGLTINTEIAQEDIDVIQRYLNEESYWARERTREQTETAIRHSICFGVYDGQRIVGFARVVSDRATFAYIGDVFVLDDYRGRGLSKWLMATMLDHPELQNLRRWVLATRDAHGLYSQFGFEALKHPDRWMELPAPNAY